MHDKTYEEVLSPNVYYDKHFDIEAVKILPGEYYVTSRDMALVTVLGSCVATCLYDRFAGLGGMNHFMLPAGGRENKDILSSSARYGVYAMEIMINELLKMGAKRNNLEAKVFGGGNVLRGFTVSNVGQSNANFAVDFLRKENIKVMAQDVLDIYPRKVYFFPRSCRVLVKQLRGAHNDTIVERERAYSARLKGADVQGDVELF
ncbi:MAG: chemoreceptor glutamine deamidase CheD [Nitrosomonadales bacterium]|nr:chemoreceptor glutamine deamidase CheD [Nitrosomonadales bacterium]